MSEVIGNVDGIGEIRTCATCERLIKAGQTWCVDCLTTKCLECGKLIPRTRRYCKSCAEKTFTCIGCGVAIVPGHVRCVICAKAETERLGIGHLAYWEDAFSERELAMIRNCCAYAKGEPAGLPGHGLMLVVAQMATLLVEADAQGYKVEVKADDDD